MALSRARFIHLKLNKCRQFKDVCRCLSSELPSDNNPDNKTSGYAKAFTKFDTLKEEPKDAPKTFAALLRQSKFVDVSCKYSV